MEDKNQYGLWKRSRRAEELQEQDVWDVLDGYGNDQAASDINHPSVPSFSSKGFYLSSPRMIPRTSTNSVGIRQQSAPVNVPDWSRIHWRKPKKAAPTTHDDDDHDHHDDDVAPEEYFMGRIRSPSFSVTEGVGRTLKGRDLSKVRNAVLKKTGFLE